MSLFLLVVIIIAAVCLGFVILIQNPKGGGLSGDVTGLSTQFMGVKQTTDTLEKGSWLFAAVLAIACLTSGFLLKSGKSASSKNLNGYGNQTQQSDKPAPGGAPAPAPVK
jgi:preprotein translocase subunit SecG